jgi:WD40 repeat protein
MSQHWLYSRVWLLCAATILSACQPSQAPTSSIKVANQGLLSAALSPDGSRLFTGSFQHGGALWDQSSNARIFDWNHDAADYSAYQAADFSEDGNFLAATDGTVLTVWDTQHGDSVMYLESPAQSVAITNTQSIWQTNDNAAQEYWQKPAKIIDLDLSKQYVLLALENQVALLVDSTQQTAVGALAHSDTITRLAMNDAASLAVTGTRSGVATIWSLKNGTSTFTFELNNSISFVEMSPDGNLAIIAAAKGPVQLVDTQAGTVKRLFKGNPGITSAAFSDSNLLALGSLREQVWLIDLKESETVEQWKIPNQGPWQKAAVIALHLSDDSITAVASDGYVHTLRYGEN